LHVWTWLLAVTVALGGYAAQIHGQAQQEFQTATNIGKESLPAAPLVYIAYAIVWIVLIGYVFLMWRRLNRVEHDLREVTARLSSPKR
jgi:CcmD family protein